jgi:crotonobetainyl-CoA:carnitine CoA-transferase CaiB-like acyl-CoA transferase
MESYSATAMEEMGVGFDVLRQVNPNLIYVQASGWGKEGPYASYLTYGPTAQAITGLTGQSGLPDREPAGWGFSYMDHSGAYYVGLATLLALYRKKRTGKGAYIDMAQAGSGLLLTGTAVLDYSANGRHYQRTGNRSPYVPAAPHGAYRCAGEDRWIAIACFDESQWNGLLRAVGPGELHGERFATLTGRLARQDDLDAALARWTRQMDAYQAMDLLQRNGVPAGVCQTAEDRVERDPQLEARNWLVGLPHSEIGTWPVQGLPFRYRTATARVGEPLGRAAPCYGEDNASVYRELLQLGDEELAALRAENVI